MLWQNLFNILNQHFKSLFTTETISPFLTKVHSLSQFQIMEQGVYNILSNCNWSKSPGLDSIHPFTLKATATEISPMLAHIFSQSFETGTDTFKYYSYKKIIISTYDFISGNNCSNIFLCAHIFFREKVLCQVLVTLTEFQKSCDHSFS